MQKTNNIRSFLEKEYGRNLTEKEFLEYKNRLVKFFSLLMEVDRKNEGKRNETKNN